MKQCVHVLIIVSAGIVSPLFAHITLPSNPVIQTLDMMHTDDVETFETRIHQTMKTIQFHVNISDPDGATPLGIAALYKYTDIFNYLQTEYGADTNNALMSAISADNAPILKALLDDDNNRSEQQMYTILSHVLRNEATQSLALLRNQRGNLLWKGIVSGVKHNDAAISEYLVSHSKVNLNEPTEKGYTLLTLGIITGNTAIIEYCKKNPNELPINSLNYALEHDNEMALLALNKYYLFSDDILNNCLTSLAKKKNQNTEQEALILHNNKLRSALLSNNTDLIEQELQYPNAMVTDDDIYIALEKSTRKVFKQLLEKRFPMTPLSAQKPYLKLFREHALKYEKKDIAKYIAMLLAARRTEC